MENVPINLVDHIPFDVVKEFEYITLDLRWAAMYNELEKYATVIDKIVNVHLRGRLEKNQWAIYHAPFTFYQAVEWIRDHWRYSGLLTVEPEGGLKNAVWSDFAAAMGSLR